MSLRCLLGIHDYDEWRCSRCHQENPRLTAAREEFEQARDPDPDLFASEDRLTVTFIDARRASFDPSLPWPAQPGETIIVEGDRFRDVIMGRLWSDLEAAGDRVTFEKPTSEGVDYRVIVH